ncbi:laccase, multicopper oxidase, benzenediol:oxygen oxidorectuctase [Steccherinum ochraceum]|uniref:laccase n=1 Tax=Steccherinum ochraceum TaxID=92696 RepID=A0A4V2MWL3_9APHY|nr:laccase, multicopper oxidase, benzenediol:oxygen oxidorectuctase [Steccherinum ochraceum]
MASSFLSYFAAFVVLSLSVGVQAAIGPVTALNIVNRNISPDGFTRPAVLADGTFPGPLLRGNKGDHFQITVFDKLTNPDMLTDTSIHWHGFFQHDTNWADGPSFITQCPITSGSSFDYSFQVPDQAGTFWYHSHLSTQYCDGLRGPLIVYDPHDPQAHLYNVDDESTIITLADWYHVLAQKEPAGIPPVADATLINGLGRFTNGPASPLAVISVQFGKRYRMRLINMACDPNYMFSIDNHDMTIIEVDGVNSQPHTVEQIQIFAAQRYSFVLNANQRIGNYWIRAQPNSGNTTFYGGLNSAILRYHGAPIQDPKSTAETSPDLLDETDLHPLESLGVPGHPVLGGVDFAKNLEFGLDLNIGRFLVNNVSFSPPSVPVLLQVLSGAQQPQDLLPQGSVIPIPKNAAIEITMPGGIPGGGHPFHLHGHKFAVVRSAGSTNYNFHNPIWRDTVNIGGMGDNVTIRFTTDNPGPWFLHCHIDWHLDLGLAVVLAEDIPDTSRVNHPPQAWKDLCPKYNRAHPNADLTAALQIDGSS